MKKKKMPITIAEAKKDCSLWTVEQCLIRALEDYRNGDIKANALLLIFVDRGEEGEMETQTYRCNLRRDSEIGLLFAKGYACIRDWIK